MDISSVNSDLIRGNVTTIILGCLVNSDRYGYEILKEIEDRSTGQYALKQATLYNQLKRLEKQGLISSYDGSPDDTGGGQRRYYTLTFEGRNYLNKEKSEYEYSRTILDKLVSSKEFDFTNPIPFDASELRPYSKREGGETKVVYKDKIVEVEKIVEKPVERVIEVEKPVERVIEVEKPVEVERIVEVERPVERRTYFDMYGNEISAEQAEELKNNPPVDNSELLRRQEKLLKEQEERFKEQQSLVEEGEAKLAEKTALVKEKEDKIAEQDELIRRQEELLSGRDEDVLSLKSQLADLEAQRAFDRTSVKRFSDEEIRIRDEQIAEIKEKLQKTEDERDNIASRLADLVSSSEALEAERKALEDERAAFEKERGEQLEKQSEFSKELEELRAQATAQKRQSELERSELEQKVVALEKEKQELLRRTSDDIAEISNNMLVEDEPERRVEDTNSGRTMYDLFKRLDEIEAEMDSQHEAAATADVVNEPEQAEEPAPEPVQESIQEPVQEPEPQNEGPYAVNNRRTFDYEQQDVNYRNFFYEISEQPEQANSQPEQQSSEGDIKRRLYAKGYKIRPYAKSNSSEYYTFKFVHSNRLNRDTFLIILALYVLEVAVMWLSLADRVSYKYFLPVLCVGVAICLIPTIVYLANPQKRVRANFNFKLSILNRSMMFIELTVVCILIGFFALGASVNDIDLILCSIVLPAVLLLNIPISSIVYGLLYRTNKYHTA